MISIPVLSPHWTLVQAWAASCIKKARQSPPHTAIHCRLRQSPTNFVAASMRGARNLLTRKRSLESHVQFYLPKSPPVLPITKIQSNQAEGSSLPPASAQTRQHLVLFWWVGPFIMRKDGGKSLLCRGRYMLYLAGYFIRNELSW